MQSSLGRDVQAATALDKHAILQTHPLLGKLAPPVIARLAACAHVRLVGAGTTIFQKGDPGL